MKIYPPYKIFLSFVLVFFCIGVFFLLKSGDVGIIGDFFTGKSSEEKKQEITKKSRAPEISGKIIQPVDDPGTSVDSIQSYNTHKYPDFISDRDIEFPAGNQEVLLNLAKSLSENKKGSGQTRILFYGDSQLEGDRITSFFRKNLQKEYGGSGPGMIPITEPKYPSMSLDYRSSRNWVKHDYLVNIQPSSNIGLGTMLSYCRFEGPDAYVKLSLRDDSPSNGLLFDCFRLILLEGNEEGLIKLSGADSVLMEWEIPGDGDIIQLEYKFPNFRSNLSLDFESLERATVFGVSLESSIGVVVDNIAHRGSAGLEFSRDKTDSYLRMSELLNPDLLILHFGINVVPAESDDFSYYGNFLRNEIQLLQKRMPDVPILLIGVSDMGHTVQGIPESYDAVKMVNEVQREVSRQTGTAFFDLLAFMGGSGSFQKWMQADPVLMRKDLTHFSHAGGALVAEGLASAIIREVNRIKKQEDNGI